MDQILSIVFLIILAVARALLKKKKKPQMAAPVRPVEREVRYLYKEVSVPRSASPPRSVPAVKECIQELPPVRRPRIQELLSHSRGRRHLLLLSEILKRRH